MPRERGDTTRYGFPPQGDPWQQFPAEPPWDTPLHELSNWSLTIVCAEHGTVSYPLRLMAAEQGWDKTLRGIVPKLRCRTCKAKPQSVTLVSDSGGEHGRAGAKVLSHRLL